MIYPCCKKELPASLDGVSWVKCPCGQTYIPQVLLEYNNIRDALLDWQRAVNYDAHIIANKGKVNWLADLITRTAELLANGEERYDCPIHGVQDGPDCPEC